MVASWISKLGVLTLNQAGFFGSYQGCGGVSYVPTDKHSLLRLYQHLIWKVMYGGADNSKWSFKSSLTFDMVYEIFEDIMDSLKKIYK